ncbi:MAG: tyrosine-type recombinase/integrase [Victivallales bacterium]|jgi:integrase
MLYQRKHSPFWTAAFYVKGADGKLVKRAYSTKTADKDKALDVERELKRATSELAESKRLESFLIKTAEKITATTVERPGLPLSLVWEKYSNHPSQKNRTVRTQSSKKVVWERFKNWLNDKFPQVETINDVNKDIASSYLETLSDKRSATFNNEKFSLQGIWRILNVPAGLKENIWELFAGAENDSVRYRDFSLEEVKGIIAVSNEFWRVAVAIGFYTGLRFKDVVFLRKTQIHGDYIVLTPQKTNRTHKNVNIYVHPSLKKILEYQISIAKDDYLFPDAVNRYATHAFQIEFGALLEMEDKKKGKKKIEKDERGIIGFHSLRHTFVTMAEEAGIERKVIQGIVGHGSPVMTGHYSHDLKSIKQIEKLPSLLEA